MIYRLAGVLLGVGLLTGMLILLEIGRRMGLKRVSVDPEGVRESVGPVQTAVFSLLGLLIAFTFSGAAARFDTRRLLIVEEANAIGTAYLRLDLLPAAEQPAMRELFRRYLDARLEVYRKLPDLKAAERELAFSNRLQKEIWAHAVAASAGEAPSTRTMLLPALNQMFDITTRRTMAARMHPPAIIFAMLATLSLVGSMMAGYGMARARTRGWFHIFGFAIILAAAVYVILDMEFPRAGLIRVDAFDRVLVETRKSMD